MLRLGDIGSSKLDADSNVLLVQVENTVTEDMHTDAWIYGALGVTARPYPADDNGSVEAFYLDETSNTSIIAMRDTRNQAIVGNLAPGDTVIHSTGPNQCAQLQLKEEKKQAVLATKTSDGKSAMLLLDGLNDKFQVALLGYIIEVSNDAGICLTDKTGLAGIQIKDGLVSIFGKVVLGGRTPTGYIVASTTPVPTPTSGSSITAQTLPGIFLGI